MIHWKKFRKILIVNFRLLKKNSKFFTAEFIEKISKIFYSQFHWKKIRHFFGKFEKKTFLPQKKRGEESQQFFQENLTCPFVGFWFTFNFLPSRILIRIPQFQKICFKLKKNNYFMLLFEQMVHIFQLLSYHQ